MALESLRDRIALPIRARSMSIEQSWKFLRETIVSLILFVKVETESPNDACELLIGTIGSINFTREYLHAWSGDTLLLRVQSTMRNSIAFKCN